MKMIEAPKPFRGKQPSLFLAGGISDTSPWQTRLIRMLAETRWMILNPRRADFPMGDPTEGVRQIAWEFHHLSLATATAFWFPSETLCPIALFELGAASKEPKPLFVGTDPQYARRFDVQEQLRLRRPQVTVVDSLEALASQLIDNQPDSNETIEQLIERSAHHESAHTR